MKTILIVCALLTIFASTAMANLYLIVNSESKEIITASESNDTVVGDGQDIITLPGKFENYELAHNPVFYFYKDDRFVLNTEKLNTVSVDAVIEQWIQDDMIDDARKKAIERGKLEGVISDDYVDKKDNDK